MKKKGKRRKWSQCVTYGKKLQKNSKRQRRVEKVNFRDFVKSYETLDEETVQEEIYNVKNVMKNVKVLKKVNLSSCNLRKQHLIILRSVFKGVKIKDLNVGCNDNIGLKGWSRIAKIARQSEIKMFRAWNCNLTAGCLEKFTQKMEGAQNDKSHSFKLLSIGQNTNIGTEGWECLGRLVHLLKMKILDARECDPTADCMESFIQGMDGAQLDLLMLDLSDTSKRKLPISTALKLLPFVKEKLSLMNWEISDTEKLEIQKKLDQDCLRSLTIHLDLGHCLKASPVELSSNEVKKSLIKTKESETVDSVTRTNKVLQVEAGTVEASKNDKDEDVAMSVVTETSMQRCVEFAPPSISYMPVHSGMPQTCIQQDTSYHVHNSSTASDISGCNSVPYSSIHSSLHQTHTRDTSGHVQYDSSTANDVVMHNLATSVPYLSVPSSMQQTSTQQDTSSHLHSPSTASDGAAYHPATTVPYTPIQSRMQYTPTQQDPSDHVHNSPVFDGAVYDTGEQGFHQLMTPEVTAVPVLPDSQSFQANAVMAVSEFTELTTVSSSAGYSMGTPAVWDSATERRIENRMSTIESTLASFQQAIEKLEEKKLKQGEIIRMQNEKMEEQQEEIVKLKREVAELKDAQADHQAKMSKEVEAEGSYRHPFILPNRFPFTLPMSSMDDVEHNESLLDQELNRAKLAEFLSKVGGTGDVAVFRIMGKLFCDRLAIRYCWTGRKKKALCQLRIIQILYRACREKNVNRAQCELAVRKWMKNSAERVRKNSRKILNSSNEK